MNKYTIKIINKSKIVTLELSDLVKNYKNCHITFSPLIKNYQYIDRCTVLGIINIFPNEEGEIYAFRQKSSKFMNSIFIVSEKDVWKINSDHYNDFDFFTDNKNLAKIGNSINTNSTFSRSGFFLKRDGFKMVFQNAIPIFLSRGTILNYKQGDFVLKMKFLQHWSIMPNKQKILFKVCRKLKN